MVGNVGWPLPLPGRAGGKCRTFAGKAVCCCSDKSLVGSCGCGKGAKPASASAPQKPGSCCQKKLETEKKSRAVAVNCACGEPSNPGFVVSSQPKIHVVSAVVVEMAAATRLPISAAGPLPERSLSPETPPPRPSATFEHHGRVGARFSRAA